ncbi:PREDICTED: protocadherin Fat 3-like isoform X2 [Priapulus caudatus]|uniref:Protocadherin Fat 3-like isoform X2 n=1 Tax=Priapulus caudatus TaxID=37621 RepID=A0ABM1FAB4_PRICU|nr:PREDICTED: protocadherin Fat 3-like isoform X2 [Priapulus caudatus]
MIERSILLISFLLVPILAVLNPCGVPNTGDPLTFQVYENETKDYMVGVLRLNGDDSEISLTQAGTLDPHIGFDISSRQVYLLNDLQPWIDSLEDPSQNMPITLHIKCKVLQNGPVTDLRLNVFVTDINNKQPYFVNKIFATSVSELANLNTTIFQAQAKDNDYTFPNNFMLYFIENSTYSDYVGMPNNYNGVMLLQKSLDYRVVKSFNITMKVEDLGEIPGSLSSTQTLIVNVIDEDNLNPIFFNGPYRADVLYSAPVGTPLIIQPAKIYAEDQDTGIMSPLLYSIEHGADGYFAIDERTGVVSTAQTLARGQHFSMLVKATEAYNSDRYAMTSLRVSVAGSNDHAPAFDRALYAVSAMENVPIGSTVLRVVAADDDGDDLLYTLLNSEQVTDFEMTDTGYLISTAYLDFTVQNSYNLTAQVSDGLYVSNASVVVTLLSANRKNPVFSERMYTFSATRNDNSFIGSVSASDPSGTEIEYTLLDNQLYFRVDQNGDLYSTDGVRDLVLVQYVLTVMACNAGDEELGEDRRCAGADVLVRLPDLPPAFSRGDYTASVVETSPVGTAVLRVSATDPAGDELVYQLQNGSHVAEFSMTKDGVLITKKKLSFADASLYYLVAEVTDGLQTDRAAVNVVVVPSNRYNPVFSQPRYEFVCNRTANTLLGVVHAQTPGSNTANITYRLLGYDSYFAVNAAGEVWTRRDLRDLVLPRYEMSVSACGPANSVLGEEPRCSRAAIAVALPPTPPAFERASYAVAGLPPTLPAGFFVLRVSAHSPAGDALSYNLLNASEIKDFEMTPTGLLKTKTLLDHSRQRFYEMTAEVTDGINTDTAAIEITVVNSNNKNPVFMRDVYEFNAARVNGGVVGQTTASDPTGRDLVYTLIGHEEFFEIDNAGEITMRDNADMLVNSRYEMSVKACNVVINASSSAEQTRCSVAQVVVKLPELAAGTASPSTGLQNSQTLIIIILACIAGVMFVAILVLSVFLLRNKGSPTPENSGIPPAYPDPKAYSYAHDNHGLRAPNDLGNEPIKFYENDSANQVRHVDVENGDSSSNQSDIPMDASSTERLYKDRNKIKVAPMPRQANGSVSRQMNGSVSRQMNGSVQSDLNRSKKRVTIGGAEEVDDWGGEHPQTDTQIETMLDPNVSVEPLDSNVDLSVPPGATRMKPELTIYF